MRLADYVASWIAAINPRVYGVCGAQAMYLNDAICNHPDIKFLAMHHEQAATFAAEADARVSGKPGIVHVTAGPGGTNTMTGLACAYVDSIPLIVIAGQVKSTTMANGDMLASRRKHGVRQLGVNELDMAEIVKPVTKYAATVFEPAMIRHHLEQAYSHAMMGRPGPVFIEIPLDVQNAEIDVENYAPLDQRMFVKTGTYAAKDDQIARCVTMLNASQRPVLIIGNGIHLSGADDEINHLVDALQIPVISSWNASDIIANDHPCYIGRMGLFGDRASNFAVQNADLILAIGTRLSLPQIGHDAKLFAPNAKKIIVDIDYMEATKDWLRADLPICADAKQFIKSILDAIKGTFWRFDTWSEQTQEWKSRYPVMLPEYRDEANGVNSYAFIEELAKHLDDDAIIVTDVGFSFIPAMQSLKLKRGQRLFHSGGVSPMGWGLPAAVGACFAAPGRQIVCLTGDGGLMLNLQELQTIAHHKLPIAIFVFENGGYKTMQMVQEAHFKREAASGENSGVSCPDFVTIAKAFGLYYGESTTQAGLSRWVSHGSYGTPMMHVVRLDPNEFLAPRAQTRTDNGKFLPTDIADLWPHLDREEYAQNMAVGRTKQSDAA